MKLDRPADPEMKVLPDRSVFSALSAQLVHPVNLDLKAHPAKKVLPVLVVALEIRVLLVLLVTLVRPAPLGFLYVIKRKCAL